jgi:hypothetical protein
LWWPTADKIAEIFGTRVHRRMHGKLATIIDRIQHGHHVFRAYFKHAFLKQYGWTARQIHHAVLTSFHLSQSAYGLTQLRYDLRKLKGHGLLQRDGSRYAYRLTQKGVQVALLFCSADPSPTAAFTTASTPLTSRPANSKPLTTAPTTPFSTLSTSSPPDPSPIARLFWSTILRARIYTVRSPTDSAYPGVRRYHPPIRRFGACSPGSGRQ